MTGVEIQLPRGGAPILTTENEENGSTEEDHSQEDCLGHNESMTTCEYHVLGRETKKVETNEALVKCLKTF